MNPVPERTINYKVFVGGSQDMAALATIELPDIEMMSDTVSGAGIAGEVESPTLGQTGSMAATMTFRTIYAPALSLNAPKSHEIDARASMQVYDAGLGQYKTTPVRVAMRGVPKRTGLGSLEVGAATDSEIELELTYLSVWVDNKQTIEIDKYNFKHVVNGVDYLAGVRADLGM